MSKDIRILIIDDESAVRNALRINLKSHDYSISEAVNGKEGLAAAKTFHPHLIILDLGLPDISGLEVLRELRKWTQVSVVVLTATDDENMKVKLLDAGADDYLTKPFSVQELMARVRVGLRHNNFQEAATVFVSDDLEVDLNLKKVTVGGELVKLTSTEYEVLSRLVRESGKVVTQEKLLKEVWGSLAVEESHYLRIYIKQLRKKIETNPAEPRHILTEPGVGYRII